LIQKELTITNPTGFHARPAALLVARAGKSKSSVTIIHNDKKVNAKSMLNLMGAGIRQGSTITLLVEGEDEAETLADLIHLIEQLPE
jgi:phosphocarrier protein